MSDSTWRYLVIVIRRVLQTPIAISVLGLGLLWSLLMRESSVGLWGLAVAITVVIAYGIAKLQDDEFIRQAIRDSDEVGRRHDKMMRELHIEELDVESRVRMKAIVKLQRDIVEDAGNSSVDAVNTGLADTVQLTDHLLERGLALAQRRRELQRYLVKTDENSIRGRIESLKNKLNNITDATQRSETEMSIAAKQQELDDYTVIAQASERILTELDSIECGFASLRARLVRIKSTDINDWVSANQELQMELGGLNTAVDSLEQSINEVLH